ncbi:MAG: DUF433 domain-containing protein [Chloroflexi bacterium]|nr:DUF433 domain-containing protein [Chloroflexota bacterium]
MGLQYFVHYPRGERSLGMLAAGDTAATILEGYPWLKPEDVQACLVYAAGCRTTCPRAADTGRRQSRHRG